MSTKTRKLQLLTELFSEEQILKLITGQLSQFVVIGSEEPENGPVFWFDTTRPAEEDEIVVLYLGDYNDEAAVVAAVDGEDYAVINADEAVMGDDGLYSITIT